MYQSGKNGKGKYLNAVNKVQTDLKMRECIGKI